MLHLTKLSLDAFIYLSRWLYTESVVEIMLWLENPISFLNSVMNDKRELDGEMHISL
jgi:hypothetical protein